VDEVNIKQKALDTGLQPGHMAYTRFVIISQGRSGTSLLNDHPQVTVFGEVFRKYGAIGWERPDYHPTPA
jgi:hypothetical protein